MRGAISKPEFPSFLFSIISLFVRSETKRLDITFIGCAMDEGAIIQKSFERLGYLFDIVWFCFSDLFKAHSWGIGVPDDGIVIGGNAKRDKPAGVVYFFIGPVMPADIIFF